MHTNSSILLIGNGRLAQHLRHWHSLLQSEHKNLPALLSWSRQRTESELQQHLVQQPLVWLAIKDNALADFYSEYLKNKNLRVVHFSGSFSHSEMLCAHPLMSFSHNFFSADIYKKIHFAINGYHSLEEALPGFKNSFSVLSPEEKSLYHALCVVAGNFPQLLWSRVLPTMGDLRIPREAFQLYLHQVTENFISLGENAVTGPLMRSDSQTIEKNIVSLQADTKLQKIYSIFAEQFKGARS